MAYKVISLLINTKDNTTERLPLNVICDRFGLDYHTTYNRMFSRADKTCVINDAYSVHWENRSKVIHVGFNMESARDQIEVGQVYTVTVKRDDEYVNVKRRCIAKYPTYAIFENLTNKCKESILYFDLARIVKGVVK